MTPPTSAESHGTHDVRAAVRHYEGVRIMPRTAVAAAVLLLVVAAAFSQTLDELQHDGTNTDHVLTYGMGYHQHRYSTLTQVNKQTVKRLVPVWNVSMSSNYGEQAQP